MSTTIAILAVIFAVAVLSAIVGYVLAPRQMPDDSMRDPFGDWPHAKDQ